MPKRPFDSRSLPTRVVIPSDLVAARRVEEQILKETESLGLQLVNTLSGQLKGTLAISRKGGTSFCISFVNPATAQSEK